MGGNIEEYVLMMKQGRCRDRDRGLRGSLEWGARTQIRDGFEDDGIHRGDAVLILT
jgi:hypothetical protein